MDFLATPARRKVLFAFLYLSEGAPIGYIWWALPTRLRAAGVPTAEVAALVALLVWPWALKFLWAPAVDILRGPRWGFRHWILAAQALMGAALVPLAFLSLHEHFPIVYALLMLHAVAACTQDVAVDALAVRHTSPAERGAVNGWMQFGMLLGRSVFGGGALILGEYLGEDNLVLLLAGTVWCSTLLVAMSTEPHEETPRARASFLALLKQALNRRATLMGIAFALLGGAGYEAVGVVAGPFLYELGLSEEQVGWFYFLPVVGCMVGGALLGGYLCDRFARHRVVGVSLVLIALDIAALAGLLAAGAKPDPAAVMILLGAMYAGIGVFTAGSYALFMDLTDPRLGATQFSTFTGMTNFCEMWSGLAVGSLIASSGYALAFLAMAAISLLALPLVAWMKVAQPSHDLEATARP